MARQRGLRDLTATAVRDRTDALGHAFQELFYCWSSTPVVTMPQPSCRGIAPSCRATSTTTCSIGLVQSSSSRAPLPVPSPFVELGPARPPRADLPLFPSVPERRRTHQSLHRTSGVHLEAFPTRNRLYLQW